MSDYNLECLYCGKEWKLEWAPKHPKCVVCNDKNIRIKKSPTKGNYFGYDEKKPSNTEIDSSWDDAFKYARWGSD